LSVQNIVGQQVRGQNFKQNLVPGRANRKQKIRLSLFAGSPGINLTGVLTRVICFSIFTKAIWKIRFPILPVNLAVEEPGILDGKYGLQMKPFRRSQKLQKFF
jgi:hypothetical protein